MHNQNRYEQALTGPPLLLQQAPKSLPSATTAMTKAKAETRTTTATATAKCYTYEHTLGTASAAAATTTVAPTTRHQPTTTENWQ